MGDVATNNETDDKKELKSKIIWALLGFIVGIVVAYGIFTMTMGSAVNKAIDSASAYDVLPQVEQTVEV